MKTSTKIKLLVHYARKVNLAFGLLVFLFGIGCAETSIFTAVICLLLGTLLIKLANFEEIERVDAMLDRAFRIRELNGTL